MRAGVIRRLELQPDGQVVAVMDVDDRYAPVCAGTKAIVRQQSQSGIANPDAVSQEGSAGTIQLSLLNLTNQTQDNRLDSGTADRPADVPAGQDPRAATDATGSPLTALHTQLLGPAVDADGNADCQVGQTGYPAGPAGHRHRPDGASGRGASFGMTEAWDCSNNGGQRRDPTDGLPPCIEAPPSLWDGRKFPHLTPGPSPLREPPTDDDGTRPARLP